MSQFVSVQSVVRVHAHLVGLLDSDPFFKALTKAGTRTRVVGACAALNFVIWLCEAALCKLDPKCQYANANAAHSNTLYLLGASKLFGNKETGRDTRRVLRGLFNGEGATLADTGVDIQLVSGVLHGLVGYMPMWNEGGVTSWLYYPVSEMALHHPNKGGVKPERSIKVMFDGNGHAGYRAVSETSCDTVAWARSAREALALLDAWERYLLNHKEPRGSWARTGTVFAERSRRGGWVLTADDPAIEAWKGVY